MKRPSTIAASLAALQTLLSTGPELPEVDRWEIREPHMSLGGKEVEVSGMLAVRDEGMDERAAVTDVAELMGGAVSERPYRSPDEDVDRVFVYAYFTFAGARFAVWTLLYEPVTVDAIGGRS